MEKLKRNVGAILLTLAATLIATIILSYAVTPMQISNHRGSKAMGEPSNVVVHHYFLDDEQNIVTGVKLANDVEITGTVGEWYETTKSTAVPANYTCVNDTPDKHAGYMAYDTTEVNYYYTLNKETVQTTITNTPKANKTVEGKEVLTQEDGVVTYTIKYNVKIKDYIGKAQVTLVDTLPAKIDTEKSDLKGGTYNPETNTITWNQTIENINSYTSENKTYTKTIQKQLSIVYNGQDVTKPLESTVTGTIVVYYPEIHPTKSAQEKATEEKTTQATVLQEYKLDGEVVKTWEDNSNAKSNRPEAIRVQLLANGLDTLDGNKLPSVILSDSNNWKYTFKGLNKYDAQGNLIAYRATESEINVDDLEYYEDAKVEVESNRTTITNTHRDLDTKVYTRIEKSGTEEITEDNREVNYNVEYKATIKNYIGEATLTLTDRLPYKIDVTKSDLAEGVYDDHTQTITWKIDVGHINTVRNGDYLLTVNKNIKVLYTDIDLTAEKMTNEVNGKIEFSQIDEKNDVQASQESNINVKGKVIVKCVDKDTNKEITVKEDGKDKKFGYELTQKVGTEYTTSQKEIYGYTYVESTKNTTGKVIDGEIVVIHYYTRTPAKILVKIVDADTEEVISYKDENGKEKNYNYEVESFIGEKYTTKEIAVPYYTFEKASENKEGTYEKEEDTVTYYYKKLPFNISVEKTVKELTVNGESQEIGTDSKLAKIEIPESKLSKTEVIVKYKVLVKNTELIDGTAQIIDTIPAEFELANTNPTYWTALQGGRITTDVELKAGEEKELEVVLKWKNGSESLGTTKSIVEVSNADNTPKFADVNADDNMAVAEVVISVKTGVEVISDIAIISGTLGLIVLLVVVAIDFKITNR